jgi:transposase
LGAVDGSNIRAKKGGEKVKKSGKNKSSTLEVVVDQYGLPLIAKIENSARHETKILESLLPKHELFPQVLLADKAYDSGPLFDKLKNFGIKLIAPHRMNRKAPSRYKFKDLIKLSHRNVVENFFALLKQNKRLETRHDRLESSFMGFVFLGCLRVYFNRLKFWGILR